MRGGSRVDGADLEVPVIETERLIITIPRVEAAGRVVSFYQGNVGHFTPWDPPRPDDFYTLRWWRARLALSRREFESDQSMRTMIFRREDPTGAVLGICNFTQMFRGPFQACVLGYGIDHRWEGKGYMHEALSACIPYVFDTLRYHRIMANYLPNNQRSARLLGRLGFETEGLAKNYLYIAGAWRDHVLTARTNPQIQVPE
ncbi:MAG: GNAT family N-acetyltransferase [Polyangiales bacterium]